MDALLLGGRVLLGDPRDGRLERCDVRVRGGVIAELAEGLRCEDGEAVHDLAGRWVLPGFVDAYQHGWHTALRAGLLDHDAVSARGALARVGAQLSAQETRMVTLGSALAQVEAGITCTLDHFDAHASTAAALAALAGFTDGGLRGIWCAAPESLGGDFDAVTAETVTRSGGATSVALAVDLRSSDGRVLDEVGQQSATTRSVWVGATDGESLTTASVAQIVSNSRTGSHPVIISCPTTDVAALSQVTAAGGGFVCTPDTDMAWQQQYTNLRCLIEIGARVGLGSGSAAVVGPDMFGVMRTSLQGERGRYQQEAAETAGTSGIPGVALRCADVLHAATLGGAAAMRLDKTCGSIEVGKAADLVVVRVDSPRLTPIVDPIVAIVLHLGVADVQDVFIAGVHRKRSGVLVDERLEGIVDELGRVRLRVRELIVADPKEDDS